MHFEGIIQFGFEGVEERSQDGGGVPLVFRQEVFPSRQVAVNEKTGMSHPSHRFVPARQQEARDVATEVDTTRFGKMRSEQRQAAEQKGLAA